MYNHEIFLSPAAYNIINKKAGRGERVRTSDILLPKQALYQAELRPECPPLYNTFFVIANISYDFYRDMSFVATRRFAQVSERT